MNKVYLIHFRPHSFEEGQKAFRHGCFSDKFYAVKTARALLNEKEDFAYIEEFAVDAVDSGRTIWTSRLGFMER